MTNYRQNYGIGLVGLGIGQQLLSGYRPQGLNMIAICDPDQNLFYCGRGIWYPKNIHPNVRSDRRSGGQDHRLGYSALVAFTCCSGCSQGRPFTLLKTIFDEHEAGGGNGGGL